MWFDDFPDKRGSMGGRLVNFLLCRNEHLTILTHSYLQDSRCVVFFPDVTPRRCSTPPASRSGLVRRSWPVSGRAPRHATHIARRGPRSPTPDAPLISPSSSSCLLLTLMRVIFFCGGFSVSNLRLQPWLTLSEVGQRLAARAHDVMLATDCSEDAADCLCRCRFSRACVEHSSDILRWLEARTPDRVVTSVTPLAWRPQRGTGS